MLSNKLLRDGLTNAFRWFLVSFLRTVALFLFKDTIVVPINWSTACKPLLYYTYYLNKIWVFYYQTQHNFSIILYAFTWIKVNSADTDHWNWANCLSIRNLGYEPQCLMSTWLKDYPDFLANVVFYQIIVWWLVTVLAYCVIVF